MPLDPFSAFSAAASAVQLVDFAAKLVSKGKSIYKSTDGALRENAEAETVTARLRDLTQYLKDSNSSRPHELGQQETQIQAICTECSQISETLLAHLSDLKVPRSQEGRKWKSFRHALKSVWSKKELDHLASRLAILKGELDSHILVFLR